jgi:3-mercaptopyruvate sulfurtransferase SseA
MKDARTGSQVTAVPAADPWVAARHFGDRLAFETDCADVWGAIEGGTMDFLIADCRSAATYEKTHIPGAIGFPWREITAERVGDMPDLPIVTYCWGHRATRDDGRKPPRGARA